MTKSIRETMCLDGMWNVSLESWSEPGSTIQAEIRLPGTLDEHRLGPKEDVATDRLTRTHSYEGPARYERSVHIPENWRGKSIFFKMERTRETELWIDGIKVGSSNSLSTPQIYDVSEYLEPGTHVIVVVVENRSGIMAWKSIRNSHMASDNTQTNWNGILGVIELFATAPVRIERVRLYPQDKGKVQGKAVLRKPSGGAAAGRISLDVRDLEGEKRYEIDDIIFSLDWDTAEAEVDFSIDAGEVLRWWDEFDPALYTVQLSLEGSYRDSPVTDEQNVSLGIRTFRVSGTQFEVNSKKTFLRGKHDGCVFPMTGYAPMDVDVWLQVFRTAKAYGINHYRFHSWCPPEAAFEAADRVGIYLQPELPFWDPRTAFENDEEWNYFSSEAFRILEVYGNHPSFVMFAWGNELSGSIERMESLVEEARKSDPSKLYAIGSNNFFGKAQVLRNSDYWTTFWTEGTWNLKKAGYGGKHVRGATPHPSRGFINNSPPSSRKDYREEIRDVSIPVIGHEVGQFQIHPNFREIDKYRGALEPGLLVRFRERAAESGLLSQADDFQNASGRLACLCYREEIEAALRTPGMAGFQLLDMQDFPGQGGAFVGILDAFMDSKGIVAPEEWRRFCSEVVPLARFQRYVWTEGERFLAQVEVANYGPTPLANATITWSMVDGSCRSVAGGSFPNAQIPQGELWSAGNLELQIPQVAGPEKWSLQVTIEGTPFCNDYSLWVYPDRVEVPIPASVVVADSFDERTRKELQDGKNVLLIPPAHGSFGNGPVGTFIPDFWCYPMFKKYDPPGTLGILCDPSHPVLSNFPTASHAEWQWWHLMRDSRAVVLDDAGSEYRPIVQVIDNVARQHKLGILFEAKVGNGKLLVCSIDLWNGQDRAEAKQFLSSLLNYCSSDRFAPEATWTEEYVESLFAKKGMSDVTGNPNADTYG
jgi:hypothetical protein